jgi:hypothetical protein
MCSIKESGGTSLNMAMEYRYGLMGQNMKANGSKVKPMEMENSINRMEKFMKDSLHMTREMAKGLR